MPQHYQCRFNSGFRIDRSTEMDVTTTVTATATAAERCPAPRPFTLLRTKHAVVKEIIEIILYSTLFLNKKSENKKILLNIRNVHIFQ